MDSLQRLQDFLRIKLGLEGEGRSFPAEGSTSNEEEEVMEVLHSILLERKKQALDLLHRAKDTNTSSRSVRIEVREAVAKLALTEVKLVDQLLVLASASHRRMEVGEGTCGDPLSLAHHASGGVSSLLLVH